MVHYIFLWQTIGLALGVSSLLWLLFLFRKQRERYLGYFALGQFFWLIRILVFSFNNYSQTSGLFFLPEGFSSTPTAGLIFALSCALWVFFLLAGIAAYLKSKIPLGFSLGYWSYYVFIAVLYMLMIDHYRFPGWQRHLNRYWFVADAPFFLGKLLFLGLVLFLLLRSSKRAWGLPVILLSAQLFDGLNSLWDQAIYITMPFYYLLPMTAFFIVLPRGLKKKEQKGLDRKMKAEQYCRNHKLNERETKLIMGILEGQSNKEIAWQQEITLSVVKHGLFQLYQKCGVKSRLELLKELLKEE